MLCRRNRNVVRKTSTHADTSRKDLATFSRPRVAAFQFSISPIARPAGNMRWPLTSCPVRQFILCMPEAFIPAARADNSVHARLTPTTRCRPGHHNNSSLATSRAGVLQSSAQRPCINTQVSTQWTRGRSESSSMLTAGCCGRPLAAYYEVY